MEERSQAYTTLHLIPQPAFLVEDGVISHVNQAAAACLLQPGQPFAPMILHGEEEYAEFQSGSLFLTLKFAGQNVEARVHSEGGSQIVILSQPEQLPHLQALALAAVELKEPLSAMMSLIQQPTTEVSPQQSQMNRRLFQMMRIVTNMSDAASYMQAQSGWMESIEVGLFIKEILDKASDAIAQCGFRLDYELPHAPVFTLADREKLERAVYNLLSNAFKYAAEDTAVHVKVSCKNKRISISVSNHYSGDVPQRNFYDRFLRQLGPEDSRNGIGLGMVFVCAAASVHGGTVLIDQTSGCIRVTLTIQAKTADDKQVRSPIMELDYGGEWDHCLLELADVLPPALYSADNLL